MRPAELPTFTYFEQVEGASDRDRNAALDWASRWVGAASEVSVSHLRSWLDKVIDGEVMRGDGPNCKTVNAAWKILASDAHRNRALKSKATFPWLKLTTQHETSCAAAEWLSIEPIPADSCPRIPLVDCDADRCLCGLRSMTQREYNTLYNEED